MTTPGPRSGQESAGAGDQLKRAIPTRCPDHDQTSARVQGQPCPQSGSHSHSSGDDIAERKLARGTRSAAVRLSVPPVQVGERVPHSDSAELYAKAAASRCARALARHLKERQGRSGLRTVRVWGAVLAWDQAGMPCQRTPFASATLPPQAPPRPIPAVIAPSCAGATTFAEHRCDAGGATPEPGADVLRAHCAQSI
jgi:hypothetical protein